jgi:hypothetical protein
MRPQIVLRGRGSIYKIPSDSIKKNHSFFIPILNSPFKMISLRVGGGKIGLTIDSIYLY